MALSYRKQKGESAFGTMLLVVLLIFAGVILMKLWSPYYDDMALKTALKNIAEEPATKKMLPKEIRSTINRRLAVNNVSLDNNEILIKKEDGKVLIDIVYERRVPMFGNIDAVLKFQHSASLSH